MFKTSESKWNPAFVNVQSGKVRPLDVLQQVGVGSETLQDIAYVRVQPQANLTFPHIVGTVQAANQIPMEQLPRRRDWDDAIVYLKDRVINLTREMQEIKAEIRQLRKAKTFVVPLTSLAPEPFQITQPIPVTVEGDGEDFTATFTEANVSASGETEADAIANFKESLLSSYEALESMSPEELGPLPTRQWSILKSVVKRIE